MLNKITRVFFIYFFVQIEKSFLLFLEPIPKSMIFCNFEKNILA